MMLLFVELRQQQECPHGLKRVHPKGGGTVGVACYPPQLCEIRTINKNQLPQLLRALEAGTYDTIVIERP